MTADFYAAEKLTYTQETLAKTNDSSIHYFSRSRISFFVTFIITMLILALFVVPIYVLYEVTVLHSGTIAASECIVVLLLFTLLFSTILSLFTKAKRHEILAAAAGESSYIPREYSDFPSEK